MTETEWLSEIDACSLLQGAKTFSTQRKFRLFTCAWVRSLFPDDVHPDIRCGVEVAEQMADGTANLASVDNTRAIFDSLGYVGEYEARGFVGQNMFLAAVMREAIRPLTQRSRVIAYLSDYEADMELENQQHGLPQVRDIFGNPFRPIDFAPWRTDTAMSLARGMYESRDFGAMPILADALQDAGCDNAEVLNHCRDAKQLHVRGCWVVDGVLGLV